MKVFVLSSIVFIFFISVVPVAVAADHSDLVIEPVTDVRVFDAQAAPKAASQGQIVSYVVTTNATDPLCDTGFEGYVDLEGFGILAQAGIVGNNVAFTSFSTGDPIRFYGNDNVGMSFTDDGFSYFASTPGVAPGTNTALPTASDPNDMIAMLWSDLEIFYDAGLNHGVSLATAGSPGGVVIVEYDDLQPAGGGPSVGDFELVVSRAVDNTPGAYEIVVAFANVGALPASVTIGVEDLPGTSGVQYLFGDPAAVVTDGLIVCFDSVGDVPVELMSLEVN